MLLHRSTLQQAFQELSLLRLPAMTIIVAIDA